MNFPGSPFVVIIVTIYEKQLQIYADNSYSLINQILPVDELAKLLFKGGSILPIGIISDESSVAPGLYFLGATDQLRFAPHLAAF